MDTGYLIQQPGLV